MSLTCHRQSSSPLYHSCTGRHILRYPDIAAHRGSTTNGDASQNGGVGIDNDVVFQNWMPWDAFDGLTVGIKRETFGSQRNALVELHVIADDARLANHHTRTMVYRKVTADLSSRVNVDTRLAVCHLRNDARYEGHAQ